MILRLEIVLTILTVMSSDDSNFHQKDPIQEKIKIYIIVKENSTYTINTIKK